MNLSVIQRMWHFHCPVNLCRTADSMHGQDWPGTCQLPFIPTVPPPSHPLICLIDGPGSSSPGNQGWHQSSRSVCYLTINRSYRRTLSWVYCRGEYLKNGDEDRRQGLVRDKSVSTEKHRELLCVREGWWMVYGKMVSSSRRAQAVPQAELS